MRINFWFFNMELTMFDWYVHEVSSVWAPSVFRNQKFEALEFVLLVTRVRCSIVERLTFSDRWRTEKSYVCPWIRTFPTPQPATSQINKNKIEKKKRSPKLTQLHKIHINSLRICGRSNSSVGLFNVCVQSIVRAIDNISFASLNRFAVSAQHSYLTE